MNLRQTFARPGAHGWLVLGLLLVLAFDFSVRWRLLDMPLERDEGEFAYAGQLLLQHASPYDFAYNAALKLPGTFLGYTLIMAVLGQTPAAIHAGIIFISLATVMLVFVLTRRICGDAAGVVGAGTYALLSINPATLGLAAHATHFVMLPALAGIVLLQNLDGKTSARRIFFAGLCLGLAVLMKQTGAAFAIFGACWIARYELSSGLKQWRRLALRLIWLMAGGLLPLALTCAVIALAADFHQFWFWTVQYAMAHESVFGFRSALESMIDGIATQFAAAPGLWSFAILGWFLIFFMPSLRRWRFFIVSFSIFSFLAVCPGWYFRNHYFIQLLPAAGLLAAAAFCGIRNFFDRRRFSFASGALSALIFIGATASSIIQWSDIYFRLTPAQASRAIYGINPFPEALEIADYITSHSAPDARIAVIGSEPEIFFYSHRHSVTGYICTYPLVEPQRYADFMQSQMIREIETSKPAYVIFINLQSSWVQSTASVKDKIPGWWNGYSKNCELVGAVDLFEDKPSEFYWDGQLMDRTNPVPPKISIFIRK
jgi:hypothetical protein